eukprot:7862342-Ditylum_brightwellii.AAC.1
MEVVQVFWLKIPHAVSIFKDIIIVEKVTNISNSQHDIPNSGVQYVLKSNGLECFGMDKSKDKEGDQINTEKVGRDDFSDDDEESEGFLSIVWSENWLPIFEGRHLDRSGHKETLQA